jgi:hypothetical protein
MSENTATSSHAGTVPSKIKLLKINNLARSWTAMAAREKKDSKNEGRSDDVYENKGQQVPIFRHPTMCMKTHALMATTTS